LIALANLEPDSEARKHLQAIARAFRAKRQGKPAPSVIQIEIQQLITVSLSDGAVQTPRSEIETALDEIDPPRNIDLVRECPKCLEIFWAGRMDKEACDQHVSWWGKREWRRKGKEKAERRAEAKARRAKSKARLDKPLSPTSLMVLDAIANQQHLFESIDYHCFWELNRRKRFKGTKYSKPAVQECLKLLVDAGYIDSTEREDEKFFYTLRNKGRKALAELWDAEERKRIELIKEHASKRPTH
jgi:DNA-binding MarR family transcriptional regulator